MHAASRNWRDPRLGDAFDQAWGLACRGVTASRSQGYVLRLRNVAAQPIDPKLCGAPVSQALTGIGPVTTRACFDPALGFQATVIRFVHNGQTFVGGAARSATGPLESMLRAAAFQIPPSIDRDATVKPTIDAARLPAPPSHEAARLDRSFDPAIALQTGISLNQRGSYVEASRLLNDALSRLTADTPALTRVELELEAGLADSNISQFDAADDHFERGTALLAETHDVDRGAALEAKRATYRGLDLLNRRQWTAAIAEMVDRESAQNPLQDPATLSRLNQAAPRAGTSSALSAASGGQLSRLLLEAQRNWGRSVALLAIGKTDESRAALDASAVYVAQLQRSVNPDAIVSLKARIQRQYGRVAARAGKLDSAITYFNCALGTLQAVPPNPAKPCVLDAPAVRIRQATASDGPMVAETELERASLLARKPNVSEDKLVADYDAGVDALIASSAAGGIVPPSLEGYLDTLTQIDSAHHSEALAQKFFRALQAVGEPAIARQLALLQSIVSADSGLGAKVRDRSEVEREVVRLRYAIASATPADAAALDALERQRAAAEEKLTGLNEAIAGDSRFRAVDDQPATIQEVQHALRPGEVYLKVSRLRSKTYAIAITPQRSFIYPLAASADDLETISRRVRASIRDESGRLPFFDVPASYALFKLVAGPAEPALLQANALIVDTAGALQNLPASVLVTDQASVRRYIAGRTAAPNDYSGVAFLAARADISNALSPRSFLIARALGESRAAHPFIGLGENAPPETLTGPAAARMVAFGTGCGMRYDELASIMSANRPVSAHEIGVAAAALGDPGAPEITERAFTDTSVMADNAKDVFAGYQVIHFATHGLPETRSQCTVVPPSLVTTLAPPAAPGQPQSDGLLSFADIAQLRLDANLVVLSACETAAGVSGLGGRLAGQDESAASLDGLVRAFITANARAVLATYWKVPAIAESEEFIRTLYATGRTSTIGTALRTAQTELIRDPTYSHPYYWGAYFLVGDASKTMLTKTAGPLRTAAR